MSDHDQPTNDQPPTTARWVMLEDAATALDITVNAVRQRIKRGTVTGEKRNGAWFVLMDDEAAPASGRSRPTTDHNRPTRRPEAPDDTERVEDLKGEIEYLRNQLDRMITQAAAERERADVLQREALQRIESLTTGADDRQRGTHELVGSPVPIATSADDSVRDDDDRGTLWQRLMRAFRGE